MTIEPLLLGTIFVLIYIAFLSWYGGRGKPLTPAEVEDLLATMQKRAGRTPSAESEPPILDEFRELARSDDGQEYYMVNLMKFRPKALYPSGCAYGDSPLAANDRYNRAIIPLLLKHGGVPILDSRVQGRFLHPPTAEDWDRVGIVRYRSRRDMLLMAIEIASKGVDHHKWASLERTQVFPVKPLLSLVWLRVSVALLLFIITLGLHLMLSSFKIY